MMNTNIRAQLARADQEHGAMGRSRESGALVAHRPLDLVYIEDDSDSVLLLQRQLAGIAHITAAYSLEHGVDVLRSVIPDAVFLDLGLPGVTDVEGVAVVRARTSAPIIIFTGRFEAGEDFIRLQERAATAGADRYLMKGADRFTIESELRFLIARHHRERAMKILRGEIAA